MMTYEERTKRIRSVSATAKAVDAAGTLAFRTALKLNSFNTLLEPPQTIAEANRTHEARLWQEWEDLRAMEEKLRRVADKLNALPFTTDFCGDKLVITGMLPNGKPTSEDEETALKMLDEYYARQSA